MQAHGKPTILRRQPHQAAAVAASLLGALMALLAVGACSNERQTVTFAVSGMTCDGCAKAIREELMRVEGVESVAVAFKTKSATIRFDPSKASPAKLARLINGLGYKADRYKANPGPRPTGTSPKAGRPEVGRPPPE